MLDLLRFFSLVFSDNREVQGITNPVEMRFVDLETLIPVFPEASC